MTRGILDPWLRSPEIWPCLGPLRIFTYRNTEPTQDELIPAHLIFFFKPGTKLDFIKTKEQNKTASSELKTKDFEKGEKVLYKKTLGG
jgi:hypothetical protein